MKEKPLFGPLDRRRTVKMSELVELTGLPRTALIEYVRRGEIPGMRSGKRGRWHFERASLEAWWINFRKNQLAKT